MDERALAGIGELVAALRGDVGGLDDAVLVLARIDLRVRVGHGGEGHGQRHRARGGEARAAAIAAPAARPRALARAAVFPAAPVALPSLVRLIHGRPYAVSIWRMTSTAFRRRSSTSPAATPPPWAKSGRPPPRRPRRLRISGALTRS